MFAATSASCSRGSIAMIIRLPSPPHEPGSVRVASVPGAIRYAFVTRSSAGVPSASLLPYSRCVNVKKTSFALGCSALHTSHTECSSLPRSPFVIGVSACASRYA